jgi:putative transposase
MLSLRMPIDKKFLADLDEEGIYHVYNRTNNMELLFRNDENRHFFLRRYAFYLRPLIDTYCWCLLSNHFHFLIKIKSAKEIRFELLKQVVLNDAEKNYIEGKGTSAIIIEKAFHRFFTSYSMAFNKMFKRTGNLFHRPFKRVNVAKEQHFTQAIVYIHANPVKHKIINDFEKYKWSSWNSLVSDLPTQLKRKELLDWFGNKELFIKAHRDLTQFYYESDIAIED